MAKTERQKLRVKYTQAINHYEKYTENILHIVNMIASVEPSQQDIPLSLEVGLANQFKQIDEYLAQYL